MHCRQKTPIWLKSAVCLAPITTWVYATYSESDCREPWLGMIVMDIAGQCQNEQNPQVVYFEVDTCPLGRLPNTVDINNTRYALYCMKYGNGTISLDLLTFLICVGIFTMDLMGITIKRSRHSKSSSAL